jgi:hypothetical protein
MPRGETCHQADSRSNTMRAGYSISEKFRLAIRDHILARPGKRERRRPGYHRGNEPDM